MCHLAVVPLTNEPRVADGDRQNQGSRASRGRWRGPISRGDQKEDRPGGDGNDCAGAPKVGGVSSKRNLKTSNGAIPPLVPNGLNTLTGKVAYLLVSPPSIASSASMKLDVRM